MDCNTARMLLPYLRVPAELADEDRAALDQHLADCPACSAHLRREETFDRSVARAMHAVTVPAGLREQIDTRLAEQQGRVVRRKLTRYSLAAACVLLALSGAFGMWTTRVAINPNQLVQDEDQNFNVTFNGSTELVEQFFRAHRLKAEVPHDFDIGLLTNLEAVDFKGKKAARLDFQSGQDRAKVYVLPKSEFKLDRNAALTAGGSHCTIEVEETRDFLFVFVYFGDANRQKFLPRGIIG